MLKVVVLLTLAASALAADLISCSRLGTPTPSIGDRFPWWNGDDENASWPYPNPNACVTWDYPFCIKSNQQSPNYKASDRTTWQYGCAECHTTCDCAIGKYCQNVYSENADFGKCVSYKERLGEPCDANLDNNGVVSAGDTNKDPFYGDIMLCSVFLTWKDNRPSVNVTVKSQVWQGYCVNGKCRECNSFVQYTPSHYEEVWYTGSAQDLQTDKTLECLWETSNPTYRTDAPHKRKPRVCDDFSWSHTNGISVAAPAALLLLISAFAF